MALMKQKGVWKFICKAGGVQYVTIYGVLTMPTLYATNWDFWVPWKQSLSQDLARVVDQFILIMCDVGEMRIL